MRLRSRVIVLEKAKKPGGNTTLGHGFLMRYTKWHEKAGLPDVREEYLNKLYEDTGRVMDYQLLRDATYGLSDMFDWLCTFGYLHGPRLDGHICGAENAGGRRKAGDSGIH